MAFLINAKIKTVHRQMMNGETSLLIKLLLRVRVSECIFLVIHRRVRVLNKYFHVFLLSLGRIHSARQSNKFWNEKKDLGFSIVCALGH